ncbi:MAG: xanthine dehydrogenase family protein molybdopterin-binding subunit [Acidimicrobiia bacterium]
MSAAPAGRFVGQSVKRVEDRRLLTGHGRYVDDVTMRGLVHAAFVRSEVAKGMITRIDLDAARALPGVRAIYTAADLNPHARAMWQTFMGPPSELAPYPPMLLLADGDVRYVGEPIAVVVADSRYIAEDAVDLVEVEIEPSTPVTDPEAALADGAPVVHRETESNLAAYLPAAPDPELDALFETAAHVITRTFRQARATNVPMETRGLIVDHDHHSGEMRIVISSQNPHEYRAFAARLLGINENKVRVSQQDVGGGFGQKMYALRDEAALIIAGYLFGRPIKWIEDRRENLMCANQSRLEIATISAAVAADGRVLALRVHQVEDVGVSPAPSVGSSASLSAMVVTGGYKIPKAEYTCSTAYTNTVGRGAYRGPWMMESTIREQIMDHIARELAIDPLELRRRNLVTAADLPWVLPSMLVFDQLSVDKTLEQAVEMIDYDGFRAQQRAALAEGRYLGLGISLFVEPSAVGFGVMASEGATVRVAPSGDVDVYVGTGNHGQSIETTIAQVVAEHLGCTIESVTIHQGDTMGTPHSNGTGGSRTAVFVGGAATKGALQIRDKVLALASTMLEAAVEDLEVANSVVSVKGSPTKAVPFAQIAGLAYLAPEMLPPGMEAGLEATVRFATSTQLPFTWSNAAHICTVEVDPSLGTVTILRYVVSEDCGNMINPMIVDGQVSGGVVQGLSGVLYENMVYDADGNPLATSFLDYLIPTSAEVPMIEIGHVETPALDNPGGFKGMGEGGAIGSPAAVANAIADALAPLGIAPTTFPMGPSEILELISSANS